MIHLAEAFPRGGTILLALALLCLAVLSGCASPPDARRILAQAEQDRARSIKMIGPAGEVSGAASTAIINRVVAQSGGDDFLERQVGLLQAITGSAVMAGNQVSLLIDGAATYDAMFQAIQDARDHINFESYTFEDDEIGRRFSDLLIRRSAEGVRVNLMYDSVGSLNAPASFFQRLRDGGVQVLEFNPVNPARVRPGAEWTLQGRDHRKILVVDGKIAFAGGVNISSVYSGSSPGQAGGAKEGAPWRDTDIRIEGPAAAKFQKLFLHSWARQNGPPLTEGNYFPDLDKAGDSLVMVVGARSGELHRNTYLMYMSAFIHAKKTIHVEDSYFVPDDQLLDALVEAAGRGVDVRIMLSGHSDSSVVYYASRSYYDRLLEKGVKLFESRDRMLHAKTAVVDGAWSTTRSMR
jgi:cardiolipin synthase